jgi:hypothetical protein
MVRQSLTSSWKWFSTGLVAAQLALLLSGCAPTPKVSMSPTFSPAPERELVYVIPFVGTLAPEPFTRKVFDKLVDALNARHSAAGVQWFFILKQELKDVDPTWLNRQVYITGEVWSYTENSGCCQTELRVKGRAAIYEAAHPQPSAEIVVPAESFFDHDYTTLDVEQDRLAQRLASEMAAQIIRVLQRPK